MATRALGRLGTECWDYDCMKVLMLTIYPDGVYVNTRRGYFKNLWTVFRRTLPGVEFEAHGYIALKLEARKVIAEA
jgi:hypothetical protein